LTVPDGMPLIVTEIRPAGGTGPNFSAAGMGSVFGLTAHSPPFAAADVVGLAGAVWGWLVEHPASANVVAAVAISASFEIEKCMVVLRHANMSGSRVRRLP